MQKFYLGVVLAMLSAAAFATLPIFSIVAYANEVSVITLLFLRFLLASIFFFAYMGLKGDKIYAESYNVKSLFMLGLLYTFLAIFYVSSVRYIPASLAALLLYFYPALVAILSFLVAKERVTRRNIFSIGVSFLGVALVLGTSFSTFNVTGIALALSAALVYSFYIVLGDHVLAKTPPLVASAYTSLFASFILLVAGLVSKTLNFSFLAAGWLPVVGVAFFSTIIALFFFLRAIELIGSTRASILSMLEPLVTVCLAAILFLERLAWPQALGGAIILAGSFLVISGKERVGKERAAAAPEVESQ